MPSRNSDDAQPYKQWSGDGQLNTLHTNQDDSEHVDEPYSAVLLLLPSSVLLQHPIEHPQSRRATPSCCRLSSHKTKHDLGSDYSIVYLYDFSTDSILLLTVMGSGFTGGVFWHYIRCTCPGTKAMITSPVGRFPVSPWRYHPENGKTSWRFVIALHSVYGMYVHIWTDKGYERVPRQAIPDHLT